MLARPVPQPIARPMTDILASFGIENVFNQSCVRYMNAEGRSQSGQPPAMIFPLPGIIFKRGLEIRFGVS